MINLNNSLKRRLTQLERQSAPAHGFRLDYGPVSAYGEEMTAEAFHERYPTGEIIHFVLVDGRPDDQSERTRALRPGERLRPDRGCSALAFSLS